MEKSISSGPLIAARSIMFAAVLLSAVPPRSSWGGEEPTAKELRELLAAGGLASHWRLSFLESRDCPDDKTLSCLLGSLTTCDKALIPSIAVLTASHGLGDETLSALLKLVRQAAKEPHRGIKVLHAMRDCDFIEALGGKRKMRQALGQAVAAAMEGACQSSTIQPLAKALREEPEDWVELAAEEDPGKIRGLALRMLEQQDSDLTRMALRWLSRSRAGILLREVDLPTLISAAGMGDAEFARTATWLLEQVTHLRPARRWEEPDPSVWRQWWDAHSKTCNLIRNATAAVKNSQLPLEERLFGVRQLAPDYVTEIQYHKARDVLLDVVADEVCPTELRKAGVRELFASRKFVELSAQQKKLGEILARCDGPLREHALEALSSTPCVDIPEIFELLVSALKNRDLSLKTRAQIAAALGCSTEQDKAAIAVLDFAKECVGQDGSGQAGSLHHNQDFAKELVGDEQAFLGSIQALRNLTRKDHGRNLEAWEQDIAKRPALGKDEVVILPCWLSYRMFFDLKTRKPPQNLRLGVDVVTRRNPGIISIEGYAFESVITDRNEKLFTHRDWTLTLGTVRTWTDRMFPANSWQMGDDLAVGSSFRRLGAITQLRGYVIVKVARNLKSAELVTPLDWIGKPIDLPGPRELGMRITSIGPRLPPDVSPRVAREMGIDLTPPKGSKVTISQKEFSGKLQHIEFLDQKGNVMPGYASMCGVLGFWTSEIELESPVTNDCKIRFYTYDDIEEVKVPFDFRGIPLDPEPETHAFLPTPPREESIDFGDIPNRSEAAKHANPPRDEF